MVINELTAGNYFGEIAAISNMRRSASVIAISPMVIGKIKIDKFRTFMYSNNNFQKRIKTKIILNYKDQNMKMIFNMIKSSMIFG